MQSTIKYGSSGETVKELQRILVSLGYDVGTIDGQAGTRTISAVTAFQRDNFLSVDGIVGPQTWQELYSASESGILKNPSSSSSVNVTVSKDIVMPNNSSSFLRTATIIGIITLMIVGYIKLKRKK